MPGPGNPFGQSDTPAAATLAKRVESAVRRDPRRATVLLVLMTVLITLWGRLFIGGQAPSPAAAARFLASAVGSKQDDEQRPLTRRSQTGLSLNDWARQPVTHLSRNFFSIPFDYYPVDPNHPQSDEHADNGAAKSSPAQADQIKERQILVENVREQAASLSLEGIVMGAYPKASVNGLLVGVNQDIGSTGFRVVKIEPRRIVVVSHGVQIDLAMK